MSTLTDFGIPGMGSGILHPLLANKFQVLYRSRNFNNKACAELSMQTIRVNTDLKKKQVSVSIEQPITGEVLELLQDLVSYPSALTVQAMDGAGGVVSTMEFTQLETVSHEFKLDYASPSRVATHEVVMEYKSIMIKSLSMEVK